jgi:hypothetical protein
MIKRFFLQVLFVSLTILLWWIEAIKLLFTAPKTLKVHLQEGFAFFHEMLTTTYDYILHGDEK